MTFLPRFSVQNHVIVNLITATVLVAGAYYGATMVREMFPDSRPNRIVVTKAYPGASPAEVEKGIALKIEEQVKDVDGVEEVFTTVHEGLCSILIEFRSGYTNMDQAVNDVKAAVDRIPPEDFPEDALETTVMKYEQRWPVIGVALYGDIDAPSLKSLAERLKDDLLTLPGVTDVVLSGTRRDEISVEVKPDKLMEFGLSFMDVAGAIGASNLDMPGGQVRTAGANVAVRTLGEKERAEGLMDVAVRAFEDGRTVYVRDVASVIDGFEDVDASARHNGKPSANVIIYKTPEQDAIHIAGVVRAMVAGKLGQPLEVPWWRDVLSRFGARDVRREVYEQARRAPYPASVSLDLYTDLSRFVQSRLELLQRNAVQGLLLVGVSLLIFLNWRVSVWVMMGLVFAVAGALVGMHWLGQTLNLMTMFGLIIVLGMLVDDGIIIGENIYTKVEAGMDPEKAAIVGAQEVTWPVICAVTTTIVAFVPLLFIEGQIGQWMGVLPIIVCIALSASLFESLACLPAHLAKGLKIAMRPASASASRPANAWFAWARDLQDEWVNRRLRQGYEAVLRFTASNRYPTFALLTACLIASAGFVAGGRVPFVFLQKVDAESIVLNFRMDVGAPVEATLAAAKVAEDAALSLPETKSVQTFLANQLNDEGMMSAPQSHVAQVFIELVEAERRTRDSDAIIESLRSRTLNIPGVRQLRYAAIQGGPTGASVHLELSAERVEDLAAAAERVKDRLDTFDGVHDIADDLDAGRREIQIEMFESGRALGLTTDLLATQIRAAFYGHEARKVQREREDVKIMVRYPLEHRRGVHDVESMYVATPSGAMIPLTEVAKLTETTGFASIKRKDDRRTVTITADVNDTVTTPDRVINALAAELPDLLEAYPEMRHEFAGQRLETSKAFGSLRRDFFAALLLVYAILAAQFRSYIQPLIVMSVIPFSLIGAVIGHALMGYPITILSVVGLVALTGIVVNDSLVLVDFVNERVRQGSTLFDAVVDGGRQRLRPILLTSITTILGIAPLMLEQSFQAKFMIPLAISISFGLFFSTVLTLILVPSLYLILNDVKELSQRWFGWPASSNDSVPMPAA